jgi:NADPH-dependent 2,4-dienoyl-CoA reductase/sulfur reductase-like enzyme
MPADRSVERSGDLPAHCAVAIVGGGPAGLAAAAELRRQHIGPIVVLEREAEAGGIPRHCGHSPYGLREFRRLLRGPDYARRLVAEAQALRVQIHTSTTVVRLAPGPRLELATPDGPRTLTADRVLLATGARESSRAARLIGGTKPGGVLSTGALQGMVYLHGRAPFRRPVILGTELVSFSALLTCRHAGIRPAAMIEPGPRPTAWAASAALPRVLRVPLHLDTEPLAIDGVERVTGIEVATRGVLRRIDCDGVLVTGGFRPEAALLRGSHLALDPATGGPEIDPFGRCSDPAFFAAGNLLRPVETAGWCWAEGIAAACAIARSIGAGLPAPQPVVPLILRSAALKYALPQRLHPAPGGMTHVQLRVTCPVSDTLSLRAGGREIWSRRLHSLPERRILIPLAPIVTAAAGNPVELHLAGTQP